MKYYVNRKDEVVIYDEQGELGRIDLKDLDQKVSGKITSP